MTEAHAMLLRRHHQLRAKGTTDTKEASETFDADDPTRGDDDNTPDTRIGAGKQDGGEVDPEHGRAQRAPQDPDETGHNEPAASDPTIDDAPANPDGTPAKVADDGSEGVPAQVATYEAGKEAETGVARPPSPAASAGKTTSADVAKPAARKAAPKKAAAK